MADPISVTASVVSLVAIVTQTIKISVKFAREAKKTDQAAAVMVDELQKLKDILMRLSHLLANRSATVSGNGIAHDSVLIKTINSCNEKSKLLCLRLEKAQSKSLLSRSLRWPLERSEHDRMLQDVRLFAQWIQLSLTIDGNDLMFKSSTGIDQLVVEQSRSLQMLANLDGSTKKLGRSLDEHLQSLRLTQQTYDREKVLCWLSSDQPEQAHRTVSLPRVDGTGQWFLSHPAIKTWRDDDDIDYPASKIIAHGAPGTGKTIIASHVIDSVRAKSEKCGIAFVYFDHRQRSKQQPSSVYASIARQLAGLLTEIPLAVTEFYCSHVSCSTIPSSDEWWDLLQKLFKCFERSYLILDALDEAEPAAQYDFVRLTFYRAWPGGIRTLATCRPTVHDLVRDRDISHPRIEVKANVCDLKLFLLNEMASDSSSKMPSPELKSRIMDTLISTANNMFLFPVLQIKHILDEPTVGAMQNALDQLPSDIDTYFDVTIERIAKLPKGRKALGMNTLMWLTHTFEPLKFSGLSEALAVPYSSDSIDVSFCPSRQVVLECSMGLVTVDDDTEVVKLVHHSVYEYLRSVSQNLFPSAKTHLSDVCLKYLAFSDFSNGPCRDETSLNLWLGLHPFVSYAAVHWANHIKEAASEEAKGKAVDLVMSQPHRASMSQIKRYAQRYREEYWAWEEVNSITPLHAACHFELEELVIGLLAQKANINAITSICRTTPLILAAAQANAAILQAILNKQPDLAHCNWYGTALHCATEAGRLESIDLLMAAGCPVDICESRLGRTPLHCAADMGNHLTERRLLENGADEMARDNSGKTFLHNRVIVGMKFPINLLELRKRAYTELVNTDHARLPRKPSHINVINAPDNRGNTPLHYAVALGDEEMTTFLLDLSADPWICNKAGQEPSLPPGKHHKKISSLLEATRKRRPRGNRSES